MAEGEILIAEDEASIREGLALLLESEGYAVRTASDGEEVFVRWRERRPDVLLLDVMMPKKNGYAVCREIRAEDEALPILFLTAKAEDVDVLRGFSLGADDYMSKTLGQAEILARIAAVLRRSRLPAMAGEVGDFPFGAWRVDTEGNRLVQGGRQCALTVREVELLRCFSQHSGELLSRDFLLTKFWGVDFEGGEDALSQAISRLRVKLGESGDLIRTSYRQGYSYVPTRS